MDEARSCLEQHSIERGIQVKQIAVLGCGPSGLLAAHACVVAGFEPVVYSIGQRSDLPGTMYLHEPIFDLSPPEPDGAVKYRKMGTRDGYALKVYKNRKAACSWDSFDQGEYPAWSAREMYNELWLRYFGLIRNQQLTPWDIDAMLSDYPLVISSIPATVICRHETHKFSRTEIWVSRQSQFDVEPGDIVYNGVIGHRWYRSCNIFGYEATEFAEIQPDLPRGLKPIATDCNCHCGKNIVKVGRFGLWNKGELVHNAFGRSLDALHQL